MNNVAQLFPTPQSPALPTNQFETVWKLWPVKTKKPLAKAKYEAIIRGPLKTRTFDKDANGYVEIELVATEDDIVRGIKAYLDSQIDRKTFRLKDDGKYIPGLSVFLNQGRFMDLL